MRTLALLVRCERNDIPICNKSVGLIDPSDPTLANRHRVEEETEGCDSQIKAGFRAGQSTVSVLINIKKRRKFAGRRSRPDISECKLHSPIFATF
jgi:hypothetical protein